MNSEYSLRWNTFESNLSTNLEIFYESKMFSDVTLACEGTMFRAHKLVLAACSPYFERIFREHPTSHTIIHLHDASAECLNGIMEFMYKGATNLAAPMVKPFLELGESLKLKGLSEGTLPGEDLSLGHQAAAPPYRPDVDAPRSTTPGAVAPSLASELKDEQSMPEPPGVLNAASAAQPSGLGTPLTHANSTMFPGKIGRRRNAIDCVEALFGMDSSSGDGFSSDSHSTPINHIYNSISSSSNTTPTTTTTTPNINNNNNSNGDSNTIKKAKRMRPTLNANSMGPQETSFDRALDFGASPPTMVGGFSGIRPRPTYELGESSSSRSEYGSGASQNVPSDLRIAPNDPQRMGHMDIPAVAPGEKWFQGRLQFMLSQRGKPLLVHDGHSFGIQYIRKDKKYWQCNLSRKYNCKARVTTTDTGDIIVTNNEHCHTEIRQHLRKDYKTMKLAASLAASRASFAVSLALPMQSNPAIDCTSTTGATNLTILAGHDSHPVSTTSGLPDTEQEIRGMNLTRGEQVQGLNS